MKNENPIKNFNEILQPYLEQHVTILDSTTKPLTSTGENYGSEMLAVDVTLLNKETNKEEILHLVAKMCPPNEWLRELFNTSTSFKKEIAIYKTIFPTLRTFQRQQKASEIINCFPECFGARVSLDPESSTVDDDAVLLLENLKLSGYEVVDRMKGFDLAMIKLLLKDLAVFHAVPIALKLLKPNVFKTKILPHLSRNQVFDALSEDAQKAINDFLVEIARTKKECLPFIDKIVKTLTSNFRNFLNPPLPREPFATINHNDYWINNTMIKFKKDKPVDNKMVDFQLYDYGSPARDVIFMLFTSAQKAVVDDHYDSLIKLYYDTFITTLKELQCDTTEFTFELFQEEIDFAAKTTEFYHVMVMLKHVLAIKDKLKELKDISEEDIVSEAQVSEEFRQKAPEIILEFIKRNWI